MNKLLIPDEKLWNIIQFTWDSLIVSKRWGFFLCSMSRAQWFLSDKAIRSRLEQFQLWLTMWNSQFEIVIISNDNCIYSLRQHNIMDIYVCTGYLHFSLTDWHTDVSTSTVCFSFFFWHANDHFAVSVNIDRFMNNMQCKQSDLFVVSSWAWFYGHFLTMWNECKFLNGKTRETGEKIPSKITTFRLAHNCLSVLWWISLWCDAGSPSKVTHSNEVCQ